MDEHMERKERVKRMKRSLEHMESSLEHTAWSSNALWITCSTLGWESAASWSGFACSQHTRRVHRDAAQTGQRARYCAGGGGDANTGVSGWPQEMVPAGCELEGTAPVAAPRLALGPERAQAQARPPAQSQGGMGCFS